MENVSDNYYQIANRKYISDNYGKTQWIKISGHEILNDAEACYWCTLLDVKYIEKVFKNNSWDVSVEYGVPGFEGHDGKYDYHSKLLYEGFEPLLYYRKFYGVKKDYVELSQEFILLNNLYFDNNKNIYYAIFEDGSFEEVIRFKEDNMVLINLTYLTRYAAAKQMAVILYFDIRTRIYGNLSSLNLNAFSDEIKGKDIYYKAWGDELNDFNQEEVFSVLMGKRVLFPRPIETCGYWPYEKKEEYVDYIIGIDEEGKNILHTCNPEKLADNFGANSNSPHYLTPVFFKKEVLQKYISNSNLYSIEDGYLRCGELWGIEIDNHHKNYIAVYLGDLGRDLPESERIYWKSFNVATDQHLSETLLKRDFLGVFTDSNIIEHKLKEHYVQTNKNWEICFGWSLFLSLKEEDKYNFKMLRRPLTEDYNEFDNLVLSLVKVIIDSLNEEKIQESLDNEKALKGISKLEKWLQKTGQSDYEEHIKFLRNLQELRSTSSGHRKGKGYEKIATLFNIGKKDLRDVFDDIMGKADCFLEYMNNVAKKRNIV